MKTPGKGPQKKMASSRESMRPRGEKPSKPGNKRTIESFSKITPTKNKEKFGARERRRDRGRNPKNSRKKPIKEKL